jgi:hypothetical protein
MTGIQEDGMEIDELGIGAVVSLMLFSPFGIQFSVDAPLHGAAVATVLYFFWRTGS